MVTRNNRLNPEAPQRSATQNLVQVLDTYVRPARDVMGEQARVQGFNALSATAGNYARKELSRELTETAQMGEAAALSGDDPLEEFREVRAGNIFRPHSRAYMDAYNATMGRVAAIEFRDNTTLEYANSGLDRNTDPEAFRTWYNERLQGFMGENRENPYFMSGAMPLVEQATFNLSARHTNNIINQMQAQRTAAARRLSTEATMATMGEWSRLEEQRVQHAEQNPEWAADIEAQQTALIANAIGGVQSDFYQTGDAGAPFRGATLDGALDYAEATGNQALLGSIASAAGSLRLRPDELLDVTNRRQRIEADLITSMRNQEFLAQTQRDNENRMISDVIADATMNPANANLTFNELLQSDPQLMAAVMASPNSAELIQNGTEAYDTVTNVMSDVPDDIVLENEADIRSAISSGAVSNPQEAVTWFREQQAAGRVFTPGNRDVLMRLASEAAQPQSVLTDQIFRSAINSGSRMATADIVGDGVVYDMTGNTSDRTALAIQDMVTSYMQDRSSTLDPSSATYAQDVRNLREQAIIAAHEEYQLLNPTAYNERFENIQENNPNDLMLSPGFMQEVAQRQLAFDEEVAAADLAFAGVEEGFNILGINPDGTPIDTGTPEPVEAPVEAQPEAPVEAQPEAPVEAQPEAPVEAQPEAQPITTDDVMETLLGTLDIYERTVETGGEIYPEDLEYLLESIQRLSGDEASSGVMRRVMRRVNALRNR